MQYFIEVENGQIVSGDIRRTPKGKYKLVKLTGWRTILQNNLYYGYYIPIIAKYLEEEGYYMTNTDIHKHLKSRCLSYQEYDKLEKKNYTAIKSTADLKKKEFVQYLKDIEKYMYTYHDIVIPSHDFF